jgi:fructose-1,6-bisphosphatase II
MGIGAAPEGVLAASAMRCLGGVFMGRFAFRDDDERRRAEEMADCDIDGVLTMECLVKGDEAAFIASGVTDGEMLRGVKYFGSGERVHSVAMDCSSGTVRFVETVYRTSDQPFWVRRD